MKDRGIADREQGPRNGDGSAPYRDQTKDEPPPARRTRKVGRIRLVSNEQLIWCPEACTHSRLPVVSAGGFKNGVACLHFRRYARKAPGEYAITTAGISVSLDEFDLIVQRVNDLRKALPEIDPYVGEGAR